MSIIRAENLHFTYEDGTPRTVTLTSNMPYNNTTFKDLPSRDEQNRNYIYSIKEESINGEDPLDAGYNQEYGISSAGVYIVRNKPATTLTVSKVTTEIADLITPFRSALHIKIHFRDPA